MCSASLSSGPQATFPQCSSFSLMGTWDKIIACKGDSRKSCPRVEATSSLKLTPGSQRVFPGTLGLEGVGKVLGGSGRARWQTMCSDPSFCSLLDHSFRGLDWFVGTDLGILKACLYVFSLNDRVWSFGKDMEDLTHSGSCPCSLTPSVLCTLLTACCV